MKVVLFCGGLGTRLRTSAEDVPKPMVTIGYQPVLWHVMKYYAYFGHTDFVLCLGYRGDAIKHFFLNYNEAFANDFVLSEGGRRITLLKSDIDDWNITFVDTGLNSSIGERLMQVERHVGNETFLATYADGLTDLWLPDYLEFFERRDAVASFLAVHSPQSFHSVTVGADGHVERIRPINDADVWINGGYFVFRPEIFSYLRPGEDLVDEAFGRLMVENKLVAYNYEGFWHAMDTFRDRQILETMQREDRASWQLWQHRPGEGTVLAEPPRTTLGA
jgi:glucose-1-phosphate cytidylyltransferase